VYTLYRIIPLHTNIASLTPRRRWFDGYPSSNFVQRDLVEPAILSTENVRLEMR
jgi:hypothetical protein